MLMLWRAHKAYTTHGKIYVVFIFIKVKLNGIEKENENGKKHPKNIKIYKYFIRTIYRKHTHSVVHNTHDQKFDKING